MGRLLARATASALCFALLAATGTARAQAHGFALDRFEPAERGSDWFTQESLDFRGDFRPALGATGDWGYRPLAIYEPNDGAFRTAIIEHMIVAHVGASVQMFERLRLGVNVPIGLYTTGDPDTVDGVTYTPPASAQTVGDVRLGMDLRLVGKYDGPARLAIGSQVFIPSGSPGSYSGDGAIRIAPRAMLAGDAGNFSYAVKLGVQYRSLNEPFAGSPRGTELLFGASAGIRDNRKRVLFGPEIYGTSVVEKGLFDTRTATPIDVLLGLHTTASDVRLGIGGGMGLSRGIGAPLARVVFSLEWAPQPPEERPAPPPPEPVKVPSDRDKDGILDDDDACPDVKGIKTDDPKTNGCPPPADKDKDGILDKDDACVDDPGKPTDDPKTNGCPDTDGDGVFDKDDACKTEPGIATTDPKTNGCPDPDRDKDGIPNAEDACPDQPGERNTDPKRNGCPAARIVGTEIRIMDQVKFATASDKILPASDPILTAVKKILDEHPEITKVSIEGHTDNRGGEAMNLSLSKRRAASVAKWLTDHGIAKDRLESQGFGQSRPIDTNSTDSGRQNNRRVEFHIKGGGGGASNQTAPAPTPPAPGPVAPAVPAPGPAPKPNP